ncbi:MAG TPA: DUF3108 domain-containing protein [Gemmatimonadaceae bacterium]|nr:DUF3108 domain-containing protein [Gemmatimonadaceae bacterium]
MRERRLSLVSMRAHPRAYVRAALAALLLLAGGMPVAAAVAQSDGAPLPFGVGEQLKYSASVGKLGRVGKAVMWIEGPTDIRGTSTYVLRFDFRAGIGLVKAEDRTESWLDPLRMAALQYHKRERHPLSRHDESVDLYPAQRHWQAADGESGESLSDAPLDELSFMYFLRTIPLTADTTYQFNRHFDAARNPTTVRVVRREDVTTAEGEFHTVLLEMRVKDPRRYRGEGVISINLSDDDRRLPVRIVSSMPVVGKATLTLDSHVSAPRQLMAHAF